MISIKRVATLIIVLIGIHLNTSLIFGDTHSPENTLSSYLDAMKQHNLSPDLNIYTQETKKMLKSWKVSSSQMDNMVRSYEQCHSEETLYNDSYDLAVIRYPIEQKLCSPWFFQNIGRKWQLDLTMMQKAVRFGSGNSWHFVPGINHQYNFGFSDWEIDSKGYPTSTAN